MRSLISIPAGFRRMPVLAFSLYTLVGSLVWNVVLIGAGYLLGEGWERVERPLEVFKNVVVTVIVAALAWFVWRRILRPRITRQRSS
jgi:membrane protein DedA with SNARE-associated domain